MSEFCHVLDAHWPCRFGATGRPYRYTRYVNVADLVSDFDEAFFGSDGLTRLGEVVQERTAAGQLREFAGERVGAPIARPHQILCIGLNYSDRTHPLWSQETDAQGAKHERPCVRTIRDRRHLRAGS